MASFSPFQNLCPQISKNLHKTHSRTLQSLSLKRHIPQSPYPDPTEPGLPPRAQARNSLNTSCPLRPWPKRKLWPRRKKKMMKKEKVLKVSMAVATCYGCGAPLQTSDSDAPGYVDIETYELVWCFCQCFLRAWVKCFCDYTVMGSWKKLNLKAFSVVGMSKFETMLNCNKSFYCFSNKSLWIAQ